MILHHFNVTVHKEQNPDSRECQMFLWETCVCAQENIILISDTITSSANSNNSHAPCPVLSDGESNSWSGGAAWRSASN